MSVTVNGPLTDYLAPAYPPSTILIHSPSSFTVTDGLNTVTEQTITQNVPFYVTTFEFALGADGRPDFSEGWIADILFNPSTSGAIVPRSYIRSWSQGSGGRLFNITMDQSYDLAGGASIANDAGVWTFTDTPNAPAAVPIQPTLISQITGLGLLGLVAWLRRRALKLKRPVLRF
jgi:hypothetical protein